MLRWWLDAPRVYALSLAWVLFILLISATPGKELPTVDIANADKVLHAIVYCILFVFIAYSLRSLGMTRSLLVAFILASAYGLLIEWMQGAYFEGRHLDYYDALANSTGAALGIVIISRFDRTF